jgi:hypothetical protein
MFSFFTALADAYSKVLMPPKSAAQRLQRDAEEPTAVLDRCLRRLEWDRSQERCAQRWLLPHAGGSARMRVFFSLPSMLSPC